MKKLIISAILIATVTLTSFSQVGVGTTTPDASAVLDLVSTTQGFLPPRMTEVQMNAIVSPAEGLMVYCSDCTPKCIYVFTGSVFVPLGDCAPPPPPTTVTGANSTEWMDRNLGANQVATSSTDFMAYGDFYQWGRAADGHQTIVWTSSTTSNGAEQANETATTATSATAGHANFIYGSAGIDFNWTNFGAENNLWQGVAGINNPCPADFRLPTDTELDNERTSWTSDNSAGAFASTLKLPVAGYRDLGDGTLMIVGIRGHYWSSSVSGPNARYLRFNSGSASTSIFNRALGLSARCIKD